jgi:hypothetical protein
MYSSEWQSLFLFLLVRFLVTLFQRWLNLWKNCGFGLAHVHPGVLVCAVMSKYMFPAFLFLQMSCDGLTDGAFHMTFSKRNRRGCKIEGQK